MNQGIAPGVIPVSPGLSKEEPEFNAQEEDIPTPSADSDAKNRAPDEPNEVKQQHE
jgi:hypothetical protein